MPDRRNAHRDSAATTHLHVRGRETKTLVLENAARVGECDEGDPAEVSQRNQIVADLEVAEQHTPARQTSRIKRPVRIFATEHRHGAFPAGSVNRALSVG